MAPYRHEEDLVSFSKCLLHFLKSADASHNTKKENHSLFSPPHHVGVTTT